jgi:hypothetical protein
VVTNFSAFFLREVKAIRVVRRGSNPVVAVPQTERGKGSHTQSRIKDRRFTPRTAGREKPMLPSSTNSILHPRSVATPTPTVLGDTLNAVKRFQLYVDVVAETTAQEGWIDRADLAAPRSGALTELMQRFQSHGFAPNKKAASASLLLRIGWAGGFAIASYMACRRVPYLHDYALHFAPNTLLRAVWVRDAHFDVARDAPGDALRGRLLESLISFTEPILAGQHAWSGFSRHALWAMVTSSWAGQFAAVARQLGHTEQGAEEARALFALDAEIARAAPDLYDVRADDMVCTCQKRASCCLYFKSPGRNFCASCPILPKTERLARNRSWVSGQRPPA